MWCNIAIYRVIDSHYSMVLTHNGRFLCIELLLKVKVLCQRSHRQLHQHHGNVFSKAAPRTSVERHVSKGFRFKGVLPAFWIELFGIFPVLRAVLHHVLAEVYGYFLVLNLVGSNTTYLIFYASGF